jgi:ADP-ribosyltransferase exoenzyme
MTATISEQLDLASADDHHIAGTPYTYRHGWVLIGPAVAGEPVSHPDLGVGVIAGTDDTRKDATGMTITTRHPRGVPTMVNIDFDNGVKAQFEQKRGGGGVDVDPGLRRRIDPPSLTPAVRSPSAYLAALPAAQAAALSDYIGAEGSAAINGSLRAGKMPPKEKPKRLSADEREMYEIMDRPLPAAHDRAAEVGVLDKMIAAHTTTKPATLFRGMALSPALAAQLKPGAVFTDKGFTSTSDSLDWAQKFAHLRVTGGNDDDEGIPGVKALGGKPVIMNITVPAGSHMGMGEADIGEYVLPRGSSYRVDSVSPDGTVYNLTAVGTAA